MEPGRELDALIAKKVMGWLVRPDYSGGIPPGTLEGKTEREARRPIPRYSTDIAAAWQVIEKVLAITAVPGPKGGARVCAFTVRESAGSDKDIAREHFYSVQFKNYHTKKTIWQSGKSAPHAICLTALKFLESG